MGFIRTTAYVALVIVACLVLVSGASAAQGIQTYLGDIVPLSGYSSGSQSVYLFLTGPNLPANGVALDNIHRRADQGGFTVVDVDSSDRWSYRWNTADTGGRLDEGTYTIWVVDGPNDLSNLDDAEYGTISVTLLNPYVVVTTPSEPGSVQFFSVPDNASVVFNGQYLGRTPMTKEGVEPGTYNISVSKFGYTKVSAPLTIGSGQTAEVNVTLAPALGFLPVNVSPSGARILLDGADAGISPSTLSGILPGNHTVSVSHEGFVTAEQAVLITAGQNQQLTIALAPVSPVPSLPFRAAEIVPGTLLAICVAIALGLFFRQRAP